MARVARARALLNTQGLPIPTSFDEESFRAEYDGSNNPTYLAYARPGSDESIRVWQISKQTFDGSGNILTIKWPINEDGAASNDYEFAWSDRATYTFSWSMPFKFNPITHHLDLVDVTNSTGIVQTLTGNSGGAVPPTGGNINTVGTGSITVVGNPGTSTLTTELTGLTNHAVLVGAGTTTITNLGPTAIAGQVLQSSGASADPAFSTATYPSTATSTGTILRADGTNWSATTATYPNTTTINQILYSSSANIVAGLPTANNGVLTTSSTGTPTITQMPLNGQLIIGSSGFPPVVATLTAGTGIAITNAAGSITISTAGAGISWTDVTSATQTLAIDNGYITNRGGGVTYTLPATATEGDVIRVAGKSGAWTIAQNANQQIKVGSSSSTVGVTGSIASTNAGDCVELLCTTGGASTVWRALSYVGNLTVT